MKIGIIESDVKIKREDMEGEWGDSVTAIPKIMGLDALAMAYDPYFLSLFHEVPEIIPISSENLSQLNQADVIIVPYVVPQEMEKALINWISRGKPVFWSKPPQSVINEIPELTKAIQFETALLSNREDWSVGGKTFSYPQALWFDSYEVIGDIAVEGFIGELPDMFKFKNFIFTSVDFFSGYEWYRSSPQHLLSQDGFTNYFSTAYVTVLQKLTGHSSLDSSKKMLEYVDVRRDFHAYGFARKMVFDLSILLQGEIKFDESDALVKAASDALVKNKEVTRCIELLKKAFSRLYDLRKQLVDIPLYLLETQHGGILYENFGFAEYDSPDYILKLIEVYLELAERKNYRFSLEIGVSSHENMAKRFPKFTKKLADYWKKGKIELVNGTYAQPYPYYFSLESTLRQFEIGQNMIEELFGQKVKNFVSQEFSLTPSLPGILNDYGYEGACHRIQHTGTTTTETEEFITWQGADGSKIKAVPSHRDQSEKYYFGFFANWPQIVLETVKNKYKSGIYTNMLDLMWVTPFREEAIRTCYYAPVFGEFLTFKDLFEKKQSYPIKEYTRDDYENLPFQKHFYSGNVSSSLRICEDASKYLEGIEKLIAVTGLTNAELEQAIHKSWKALNEYQNHDSFAVPLANVGGHTRHFPGMPSLNRFMTVELQGRKHLVKNLKECREALEEAYKVSLTNNEKTNKTYYFNPNSFIRSEYIFADKEGNEKSLFQMEALSQVSDLQKLTLPPMGIKSLNPIKASFQVKEDKENYIVNDKLKVSIDRATGAITSIVDLHQKKECIRSFGNRMIYGENGDMSCSDIRRFISESVQQMEICGSVYDQGGMLKSYYKTYITITEGSARIYFNTILTPLVFRPEVDIETNYGKEYPEDQWQHSVRVDFDFNMNEMRVSDCWMNLINRQKRKQFQSLNFLLVEEHQENQKFLLHNRGNQHYEVKDSTVSNILWHQREERLDYQYALELLGDEGELKSSLDYQQNFLAFNGDIENPLGSNKKPWVMLDNELIYISALRKSGEDISLRLIDTSGKDQEVTLTFEFKIQKAIITDGFNHLKECLEIKEQSKISVKIHKWSITNLLIQI